MSHRSASVLAVLLLACGSSVPPPNAALAPGLVPTEEPLLRELCPGVAGREPGDYASVVALYGRFHGTEDLALRRSLLCAPETTHRGFAHGGYGYASRVFETDAARGIALFAALAREYAEPQALGDLALAHAGGIPGVVEADVGAAYCEAYTALAISNSIRATDGDGSFHTELVGRLMVFVVNVPSSSSAGSEVTNESIQACVTGRLAAWEAHFGHVMSDHEINEAAFERVRHTEPQLDRWAICPCDQLVTTPDGQSCSAAIAWEEPYPEEVCVTFRTHADASEDEPLVIEVSHRAHGERPPEVISRTEVSAVEGRSGAARNLVIRLMHTQRIDVQISAPSGLIARLTCP
jgi:hypothetical protein